MSSIIEQLVPGLIFIALLAVGVGLALGPHTDDANPPPTNHWDDNV